MKALVFDLDDTLYLEREYVYSGFQHVARYIADKTGLVSGDAVWRTLKETFEQGIRGRNFNLLFDKWPEIGSFLTVSDLVLAYREHCPEIRFQAGMETLLADIRGSGILLGVISDGPLVAQRQKAKALGLAAKFDEIVFTDFWGKEFWKPSERAFAFLEAKWNLSPSEMVYIGDNPKKDFFPGKRRGWMTMRLRILGQEQFALEPASHEFAPDMVFHSVENLSKYFFPRIRL
jgi:putative hydrolase of the HAD superfamily